MRSFRDESERLWDVAVGRESWGTFVLIFSERDGTEVRKAPLGSETALDAQAELDALAEPELRARLATSQPWA